VNGKKGTNYLSAGSLDVQSGTPRYWGFLIEKPMQAGSSPYLVQKVDYPELYPPGGYKF
jgi:hypothetical protein